MPEQLISLITTGLLDKSIELDILYSLFHINEEQKKSLAALIQKEAPDTSAINKILTTLTSVDFLSLGEEKNTHKSAQETASVGRALSAAELSSDTYSSAQGISGFHGLANTPAFHLANLSLTPGVLAYTEYQHLKKSQPKEKLYDALVQSIEKDTKKQHLRYQFITKCYLSALKNFPNNEAILHEWSRVHQSMQKYLHQSLQNIARLGAEKQQMSSKQRMTRASAAIDVSALGLIFIGPVAAISYPIKLANNIGQNIGEAYAHQSAINNHLMLDVDSSLYVSRETLSDTLKNIRKLEAPQIHFRPPTLPIVGNVKDLQKFYNPLNIVSAAKASIKKACGKGAPISISLPFLTPPDIAAQNMLPQAGEDSKDFFKEKLLKLKKAQVVLNKEYTWMLALCRQTLESSNTPPYISNLEDIQMQLTARKKMLADEITALQESTQSKYEHISEKAALKGISTLGTSATENNAQELARLAKALDESPHKQHFQKGTKPNPEKLDEQIKRQYKTLLIENLEALETSLTVCVKMGEGRHLANTPEILTDLRRRHEQIKSTFSQKEQSHFTARMEQATKQSLQLDQQRMKNLDKLHKLDQISLPTYHREIATLKSKILDYPSSPKKIAAENLIKEIASPNTLAELASVSSVNIEKINSSARIVIPSRDAFGLTKTSEQNTSVEKKISQLGSIRNIQILPLQAFDHTMWIACRRDEKILADMIEGLKTEMQWVAKFIKKCKDEKPMIEINNLKELLTHYEQQINFISYIQENRDTMLNTSLSKATAEHHSAKGLNLAARVGSVMTTTIRGSSAGRGLRLQNTQKQLTACKEQYHVLNTLSTTNESANTVQFKKQVAEIREEQTEETPKAEDHDKPTTTPS